MAANADDLLPTAKDFMRKPALAEAEEAAKAAREREKAEAEKQALLRRLEKPSGISDDERIKRAVRIFERAVRNKMTEVEIYRFPGNLCTDHGRAINQQEQSWENTLTGVPNELYETWAKYFRPRGY
jgi:uncharacterized protein (DUF1778 family)